MQNKIVVTGMGVICAAGNNLAEFSTQLFNEQKNYLTNFHPPTLFESSLLPNILAAEVRNYNEKERFTAAELKQFDRFTQFALIASSQAIKQANIEITAQNSHRISAIFGTGIGGQTTLEQSYQQRYCENKTRAHPFTVPKLIPSAACSQISIKYGITGPSFTTSSACSSSGHAITMATLMLRSGLIDVAIVGGSEACITEGNFYAWQGLRVMSAKNCSPFAADRSGLIIGEGAGCLVLETATHAAKRNAKVYAELAGIGMSSDAHNIVQPDVTGAAKAMQNALDDANCKGELIDYVNAHGSGTLQNDQTESDAINKVFQQHSQHLLVSSTKSLHGHVLGAGSAIESIATILAMMRQKVPPTRNVMQLDTHCKINCVINAPLAHQIKYALCNSFAFGGLNTSLLFKQFNNID